MYKATCLEEDTVDLVVIKWPRVCSPKFAAMNTSMALI